ncbi:MAG: hypothetical protein ACQGVK_22015 [Myxococcota bacterium]
MNRSHRIWMAVALLTLATLPGLGCAFGEINLKDPFNRGYSLREAQRKYTEYVRWSEFKKAAGFVQDDLVEAFLRDAPSLKELRFTDYEIGQVEIDDETGESTVEVTYYAYQPASPLEITIVETQHWQRDSIANDWMVKPVFEGLDHLALRQD